MEKNNVKISVIVPVYNCVDWLADCVESVLKQTFESYELILVNDGSTDGSEELCKQYAEKYEKIKVIHKKNGGGAGEARNYGLAESRGEFVVFLDGDDCQTPKMLETLYETQCRGNFDLVICGYQFLNDHQKLGAVFQLKEKDIGDKERVLDYFVKYYPDGLLGYPWNKLYRRSIIQENHICFPRMRRLEDGIFNVEYIQHTNRMTVIELPLVHYRVNSQVLLRKLPYDFYENMRAFSQNYYSFLKKTKRNRVECETPFVFYFLNDFVCCLENILANHWPGKSFQERKAYIMQLRQEKLVRYMIRKSDCVPRYSRLVVKLFSRRQWIILTIVIHMKLWMKKYLKGIFAWFKDKMN